MGQYYLIVNLDKGEYLHPHRFGDGQKLTEFGCSSDGTMTALALLLADGNGRGIGDIESKSPIIGLWAGDRIVVAGDYADGGRWIEDATWDQLQSVAEKCYTEGYREAERVNLFHWASECFRDISDLVIQAMLHDPELRESLTEVAQHHRHWADADGPLAPSLKALVA